MKTNKYLDIAELQQSLEIADDCFCEALLLIVELSPELHEQAIKSCEHCLSSLAHDLESFKREVLHINQSGQKIDEEESYG